MVLILGTTAQTGTSNRDFMLGDPTSGPNHVMNGNSGGDIIYGDFDTLGPFSSSGFQFANSITGNPDCWSTYENSEIFNSTTIPHATVYLNPTPGYTAWYAVTVVAGATITLDVDSGHELGLGYSAAESIAVFGVDGSTILAQNFGGGGHPNADFDYQNSNDPFLQYTFASAGTYYIQLLGIMDDPFYNNPDFLLNISLTGQAVTNSAPVSGSDLITGDSGDDFIDGGGGDDTIYGGADNDVIAGGSGGDTIFGGSGLDTIYISGNGAGRDIIDGGTEIDTLDLSRMTQFAWVNLAYNGDEVQTKDGAVWRSLADMTLVERVNGTHFNDFIYGDIQANEVRGNGGNDVIYGQGGNDALFGGAGSDSLYGGADSDTLVADAGNDYLNGGSGNDSFYFYPDIGVGFDTIDGDSGTDTIHCTTFTNIAWIDLTATGYELYTKTSGGAWLSVANVSNVENVIGSFQNDEMYGDGQNNLFIGESGNDTLDGRGGYDTLNGWAGNDTLIGGDLSDTLDGGTGNDTFVFSSNLTGIDTVQGGADSDTADCSAFLTKAWVDLANLAAEIYTFNGAWKVIANTNSVENAIGSAVADELYGNGESNAFNGGGGADIIQGRGGADTLTGGTGSDTFKFTAGDSGQDSLTLDQVTDYAKGAVGTGDKIDFSSVLTVGGITGGPTAGVARINAATGVASFFPLSGATLADAINDITASFTAGGDAAGEFAFFKVNGTGPMYMLISDGAAGVTANDVLIQLTNVTSVSSINLTGGDLTILT